MIHVSGTALEAGKARPIQLLFQTRRGLGDFMRGALFAPSCDTLGMTYRRTALPL